MFNTIFVVLDISEMGQKIFDRGVSLAKKYQSNLILLHVLSAEEDNSPFPIPANLTDFYAEAGEDLPLEDWRQEWEEFEQQGLETLKAYSEQAINEGVSTKYIQVYGSPAQTISQLAQEWNTDLIVVGHRQYSGFRGMRLEKVSHYLLNHTHCSVLIVQ